MKHKQVPCNNGNCDNCLPCHLTICSVCNGGEGTLTTECPGEIQSYDKGLEIFEKNLDYTVAQGWHTVTEEERRQRYPIFE
jgi:hypothetical protein